MARSRPRRECYERIRRKLILFFASRGGLPPEEMADECIDRVMKNFRRSNNSTQALRKIIFRRGEGHCAGMAGNEKHLLVFPDKYAYNNASLIWKDMSDWSKEDLDRLLAWLDRDRDRAGEHYEMIRRKLILFFASRGWASPEQMTDDCIDRVMKKLPEIEQQYTGSPENYFFGVARIIELEWRRKDPPVVIPPVDPSPEEPLACLDGCLDHLPPSTRELVLEYYQHEKRAKIDHHIALAQRLGIAVNALRIRAHRIRKQLEKCVIECMDKKALALEPQ